jgi:hypothetical protein
MLSLRSLFQPRKTPTGPQTPEGLIESTRKRLSTVLGSFLPSLKPLEQAKKWVLNGLQSLGIFSPEEGPEHNTATDTAAPLLQDPMTLESSPEMSLGIAQLLSKTRQQAAKSNESLQLPEASESPALTTLATKRLQRIFSSDPVPDGQLSSLHEQDFLREHQVFENIARGFDSAEQAMESWIQSEGHYRAMLSNADQYGLSVMKNPKDHKWYSILLFQKGGSVPSLAPEGLPKYSVLEKSSEETAKKESSDEPSPESEPLEDTN